ncbi:MAG: hypothetical protein ACI88H_000603 [Cocleimonas sp.]|jgi:hypothetical protein
MNTREYLEKVNKNPEILEFNELMELIENEYNFVPSAFKNGELDNSENENSGSCKLFSFAQIHSLTISQTLACFGTYYREDVLQNPDGEDHQNIRNFMQTGWDGVIFNQIALKAK